MRGGELKACPTDTVHDIVYGSVMKMWVLQYQTHNYGEHMNEKIEEREEPLGVRPTLASHWLAARR